MSLILYTPPGLARDEIRLLTILPETQDHAQIQCQMRAVSLHDYKPQYRALLSRSPQAAKSRDVLANWVNFCDPQNVVDRHHCPQVPGPNLYRYNWGDFVTLSYTWGEPDQTETIILNDVQVRVGRNLAHGLRVFRRLGYFSQNYMLWVDAVCINQDDDRERGVQVGMMRDLYAGSWTTVTFLGRASEESGKAIELLKTLARSRQERRCEKLKNKLQGDPGHLGNGRWLALQHLLQRPYWSRLWIVQEMALAPLNMVMFAGNDSITWKEVQEDLWSIHTSNWYVKDACLAYDRRTLRDAAGLTDQEANLGTWNTENLHHITKNLGRIAEKEDRDEGYLSIDELLEVGNATISHFPVDKVYGLLAVIEPNIAKEIVVDYSISESTVFTRVSKLFVESTNNLELLRSAGYWNAKTPSWAAEFSRKIPSRNKLAPKLPYQADKGTSADFKFSMDLRSLTVKAVIVDSVRNIGGRPYSEHDVSPILEQTTQLKETYKPDASTRSAFHRTLVGDRDGHLAEHYAPRDGGHMPLFNLPASFNDAMAIFDQRKWTEFAIQGHRYKEWSDWRCSNDRLELGSGLGCLGNFFSDEMPEDTPLQPLWHAFLRFRNMISGRRFVTTTRGNFGWVPEKPEEDVDTGTVAEHVEDIKCGDLFCIVLGCSVPLVVRRREAGDFIILGEGYIQGYMDGELAVQIERGEMTVEDLTFS